MAKIRNLPEDEWSKVNKVNLKTLQDLPNSVGQYFLTHRGLMIYVGPVEDPKTGKVRYRFAMDNKQKNSRDTYFTKEDIVKKNMVCKPILPGTICSYMGYRLRYEGPVPEKPSYFYFTILNADNTEVLKAFSYDLIRSGAIVLDREPTAKEARFATIVNHDQEKLGKKLDDFGTKVPGARKDLYQSADWRKLKEFDHQIVDKYINKKNIIIGRDKTEKQFWKDMAAENPDKNLIAFRYYVYKALPINIICTAEDPNGKTLSDAARLKEQQKYADFLLDIWEYFMQFDSISELSAADYCYFMTDKGYHNMKYDPAAGCVTFSSVPGFTKYVSANRPKLRELVSLMEFDNLQYQIFTDELFFTPQDYFDKYCMICKYFDNPVEAASNGFYNGYVAPVYDKYDRYRALCLVNNFGVRYNWEIPYQNNPEMVSLINSRTMWCGYDLTNKSRHNRPVYGASKEEVLEKLGNPTVESVVAKLEEEKKQKAEARKAKAELKPKKKTLEISIAYGGDGSCHRIHNGKETNFKKMHKLTEEDFMKGVPLKGGEFGVWENEEDRQINFKQAYLAFKDLGDALNIKMDSVTFNKDLYIGWGSRGVKGAMAHYEPGRNTINLTKLKGAGCLGHEWFHGLDYNMGHALEAQTLTSLYDLAPDRLPKPIFDAIDSMLYKPLDSKPKSEAAKRYEQQAEEKVSDLYAEAKLWKQKKPTRFYLGAKGMEEGYTGYWSTTCEMFARVGHLYLKKKLADQNSQNDYLCGTAESAIIPFGFTPEGEEWEIIEKRFDEMFDYLKEKGYLKKKGGVKQ